MWRDITITRLDKKGKPDIDYKPDVIPCGTITYYKPTIARDIEGVLSLRIQSYDGVQGTSGKVSHVYVKPQLVRMDSQEVEFMAVGWGVSFSYKDKECTKPIVKNHPEYKVKITAKF